MNTERFLGETAIFAVAMCEWSVNEMQNNFYAAY